MTLLDTKRPRLLLAAFCLLLWLPGFFTLPPTDRDESRFAQASKQMLETGDFVRIMNGAEPRNRKPIGIYWLQTPFAAAARAAGIALDNPIWPYRLPSLLGGFAAVFSVLWLGEALFGHRAALLGAAMLAASVVLVAEVHLAKTDAALLGCTTFAMGFLARAYTRTAITRWQAAAFWLAVAGGILLKGPITPMVIAFTAIALAVWDRRARWLLALRPGWGAPLMVLAVAPWFVAIGLATHGTFFHDAIGGDLAAKLAGGDDAHGAPPGLHLLLLPLLVFPSSFAILAALPLAWRARGEPGTRFLLAWIVPCWLVFEAVPTKLPHYTLPLYPALCLLGARFLLHGAGGALGRWRTLAAGVHVCVATLLATACLAFSELLGSSMLLGFPAAMAVALVGWLGWHDRRGLAALAAMPVFTFALLGRELPQADGAWLSRAVERTVAGAGYQGERLGAVGFHEPSLVFLAGTTTDLWPDGVAGADALAAGTDRVVVIAASDTLAFTSEAGRLGFSPVLLGEVVGLNYSRGRAMVLKLYRR